MTSPVVYWRNKKNAFSHLNKVGRLISFTKIHNPPIGFGKHAYWVGIVEFSAGEKKTGQLVLEGKTPKIDAQVIGIARKPRKEDTKSVISYGVKFKLL